MSYDDLCNCRKKLDGVLRKKLGNVGGGGKSPIFCTKELRHVQKEKRKKHKLSLFIMVKQCNNTSS